MHRNLLVALGLLMSLTAFADKVPPAPEDCPPGSTGDTGHEGPHCIPLDCTADSDCKDGKVCQERPLCIEKKMLTPGRSRTPFEYVFVYATCEAGEKCSGAATCTTGKRCVAAAAPKNPPADPPKDPPKDPPATASAQPPANVTPPVTQKGGCSTSPGASEPWVLILFLGFWVGVNRSRRNRSGLRA
jgi:hypothetical protein